MHMNSLVSAFVFVYSKQQQKESNLQQKANGYDQEMSQSQVTYKPVAPMGNKHYDTQMTTKSHTYYKLYLHFNCESLNEPLHLRCCSYLHERIYLNHANTRAV